MMKRLIAFVLLFVLALSFSGCSSSPTSSVSSSVSSSSSASESVSQSEAPFDPAEKTLMLCFGGVSIPFIRIVEMSFIEKAKSLGYENFIISGSNAGTMAEIFKVWYSDIQKYQPDAVLFRMFEDEYAYSFMWDIADYGGKCAVLYYPHTYDKTHDFICANPIGVTLEEYPASSYSANTSAAAAEFIAQELEKRGITSGSIGFSQTMSHTGSSIRDMLAQRIPDFNLLYLIFEGAETEEAQKNVEQIIKDSPDIVAAYGASSGSAASWSAAKESLGRSDIIVLANGVIPENLDILTEGGVDGLIAEPIFDCAEQAAVMLDASLRGKVYDEDEWQPMLDGYIVTADGEGKNGAQYYYDLYEKAENYDWSLYDAEDNS